MELSKALTAFRHALFTDGTRKMEANLDMNSHRVTGVSDPVSTSDAISKGYLDNLDITGRLRPPEEFVGSDCDNGIDGDALRTITLENTVTTSNGMMLVFVEGLLMRPAHLTITHKTAGTTIKFTDVIFDTDHIVIYYITME